MSTAVIKISSLTLSFNSRNLAPGDLITFLDPLTSINFALFPESNSWRAVITNPHQDTHQYPNPIFVYPGQTIPIGTINQINYSVQFSDDDTAPISESIRVTITGI